MRIIFSRKGFDSSRNAGGCPSPIFPDGSMLSIPIPDRASPVRYADLTWRGQNVGEMVEKLTRSRVPATHRAHLDPDVRREIYPRKNGWRAVLGQTGPAQGHLRNQGVAPGDLFVFWGVFRPTDANWRRRGPDVNVIWGWMQVGAIASVDDVVRPGLSSEWRWAKDHPHLAQARFPDASNTIYVAADDLVLDGAVHRQRGSGVFDTFDASRQLSASGARASIWELPAWFHPQGRSTLTYHADPARWRRRRDAVLLRVTSPGQEFVLDCAAYPEALEWVARLAQPQP